jgi:hypothetical protein
VRRAWLLNKARAEQADYVLAVRYGLVIGVYRPKEWYYAGKRIAFNGTEADAGVKSRYLNRRIPDAYMQRGAAAPVQYTFTPA